MRFTEEQYKNVEENLEEIVKIVTNKSGVLSAQMIKLIEDLGKAYFPHMCAKCSAGRFNIVTRLYQYYLEDKQEKEVKNEKRAKKTPKGK